MLHLQILPSDLTTGLCCIIDKNSHVSSFGIRKGRLNFERNLANSSGKRADKLTRATLMENKRRTINGNYTGSIGIASV